MPLKKSKETKKEISLHKSLLEEMLRLSTSGLGLVAALAWNEVIKETVNNYIRPVVGKDSGLISLFIYALIVTTLAVIITYNLSRIRRKLG